MTSVSSSTATGSNVTPPAATAPVTSPTTTGSTAAAASVNFNSFLQDPTNPSDPTQYLTQIAQFSNVQQGILTNTKLDSMLTATSLTQAESIIGKTVSSASGAVSGTVASVALTGGGNATATLTDGSTLALDSTVKVSAS